MARRADPREPIWHDGPELFEFLLDADFTGPETTDDGIAYHRPRLHLAAPPPKHVAAQHQHASP